MQKSISFTFPRSWKGSGSLCVVVVVGVVGGVVVVVGSVVVVVESSDGSA